MRFFLKQLSRGHAVYRRIRDTVNMKIESGSNKNVGAAEHKDQTQSDTAVVTFS